MISVLGVDEKETSASDEVSENSVSASEELEMEEMNSDVGSEGVEETGLTGDGIQKHSWRKRRRNPFEARIAGEIETTKEEARIADKDIIKRLLVNAGLIGLWYLFSLSISIYNKWMFSSDHLDFHFPLFTTSLHMLVQFSLASLILFFFPSLRPGRQPTVTPISSSEPLSSSPSSKPLITPLFYFTRLVPCGTATSLDIGLGNTSLRFITLTFLTMCKSSALAFVLLFAFLFRLETPSWKLILIIGTMTIGVVMMVAGETAFDVLGFALVIASAFFSGFRWALTQILLLRHPATCNPFATLFFLAPIMLVTLAAIACFVEGPLQVLDGLHILSENKGFLQAILLLLFPGCLAFCMTSAEFALLQRTNVVTLSICGIFKEVVTISAAGIVFHDPLTPINVSGLVVTISSIAAYNYIKITKMRQEARKEAVVETERRRSVEESFLEDSRENSIDQTTIRTKGKASALKRRQENHVND